METAEFAVVRGVDDVPAFKCWLPCTLRRRDRIIADVNKRISRITHKCGVERLTSVAHTKQRGENSSDTLWMDATNGEIENLMIAFYFLEDGAKIPVGHGKASGHLVFDILMALERKDRWGKDTPRTPESE